MDEGKGNDGGKGIGARLRARRHEVKDIGVRSNEGMGAGARAWG